MNLGRSRSITLILSGAAIVAAVFLLHDQLSFPRTQFPDQRRQSSLLRRWFIKPVAKPERSVSYEGEDIWVDGSFPKKTSADHSVASAADAQPARALLRIFRDANELTDSLFTDNEFFRHPAVWRPAQRDSTRWKVNGNCFLEPGTYWGVLDAGVMSKKFTFRVIPLPDSLSRIWALHVKLGGIPSRRASGIQYKSLPPQADSFWPDMREYMQLQVPRSPGSPLRSEGLRLCVMHVSNPEGIQQGSDSVFWREVAKQYVQEPRTEPKEAIMALLSQCKWVWGDCVNQLAAEWGGERIVEAVKLYKGHM